MPYDLVRLQADVAQVQHDKAGFGTGRLVADDLILTSAHVLRAESGAEPELQGWQVRLARDRSAQGWAFRRENRVVWYDLDRDLALIQIVRPDDGPIRPHLSLRVATITSNDTHLVEARGYPRASKQGAAYRDLTPVLGRLTSADPDRPLRFGIDQSDLPDDPRVGWPGLSGSTVLRRDAHDPSSLWAYGVVQEVPASFSGQLHVARLSEVWDRDSRFRNLLVGAGVPDLPAEDPSKVIAPGDARVGARGGDPEPRHGIARIQRDLALHRFLLGSLASALLPALTFAMPFAPPWPGGISLFSLVTYLAALIVARRLLAKPRILGGSRVPIIAIAVAAICMMGYLALFSAFTIHVPEANRSMVIGFECSHQAKVVFGQACPFLGLEEFAGVAYDEFILWTRGSITAVRLTLVVLWLSVFLALAVLVAYALLAFPSRNRRGRVSSIHP